MPQNAIPVNIFSFKLEFDIKIVLQKLWYKNW